MNFELNEEQVMIQDSVSRFLSKEYDFDSRQKLAESDSGYSSDNWQQFADLGWLSIPFSEELGGFGGSPVDTMVIMEQFGKALVLEPFLPTVLLFGGLLSEAGDFEQKESLIIDLMEGRLQGAFAYLERQSRFDLCDVKTSAVKEADTWIIEGEKTLVLNGMEANKLVVSARSNGAQADQDGVSLFLVDAEAEGIEKISVKMMDGQRVANIRFNNVRAEALIGQENEGFSLIKPVVQKATIAICAEAVGIMQKLTDTTVEYSKTRKQFGVTIGSFQALQHRMVDMFSATEQCRSLLFRAVCSAEQESAEAEKDIMALKFMVGRAGKLIAGEAVQLHGGMGITDELDVGHYMKRLMLINVSFGDSAHNLQRLNELHLDCKK